MWWYTNFLVFKASYFLVKVSDYTIIQYFYLIFIADGLHVEHVHLFMKEFHSEWEKLVFW